MPAYPDVTPQWLKSKMDPSVLDSTFTKVIRALATAIGADDPASQVMGLMGTGVPAGKAANAALDMSHAARMQRAREQGFDTSQELYHGTTNEIKSFQNSKRANIYLTNDPAIASGYAENYGRHKALREINAGPNVLPLYAKARKRLVVSDLGPDGSNGWNSDNMAAALGVENPGTGMALYDEARRQGYDLVEIRDMIDLGPNPGQSVRQTQFIPLRAENVRSRFAAFDPSRIDHNDLLASLGGVAATGSLIGGDE